ncbi:hypothetical protein [Sphingomonas sp. Mn802worker]|uniref:hypothetical protein n=1 Tax=Sphingomonas sp. Mn802worker TaxID=629773 RepID=UPI000360F3D8|nr:hypothetical protein [Sphingomonas sp. Mn802worker]
MDLMTRFLLSALLVLALAGCGDQTPEQSAAPGPAAAVTSTAASSAAADPALTAALRDQIMVDPSLVQQANADTVRPPTQPQSGALPPVDIAAAAHAQPAALAASPGEALRSAPAATGECRQCAIARRSLTLGALAEAQGGRTGQCAANVDYSAGWANRLPREVPLYPDARVTEAAGADGQGCALRVVSFSSAAPMQRLLDWYYTKSGDAGYTAQHQADGAEHVLAGNRRGGGSFLALMRARQDGGTDVDLMADGG